MKLLVKSDDYGFTKAVTDGAYDGCKNGIITCTGLFANMPSAKYAVEKIKDLPNICFGIDIDVVSGPCVSDPKDIPTLVDENGEFILSGVKRKDPRYVPHGENEELWPYAECYKEGCAQVEKFIELTGKLPEYVSGHSISANAIAYTRALSDIAKKYGIPYASEFTADPAHPFFRLPSLNVKPFTVEAQLAARVEDYTLEQLEKYKDKEYVMIGGHCGFVDDDLLKYSTYTIIRVKDHRMYTSDRIKQWIKDNHVELVSFRDFK